MTGRILYEVQASFTHEEAARRWEEWLRAKHIADVVAAGALDGKVIRLDSPAATLVAQYWFESREAFDRYLADQAPRLRAEGIALFAPEEVTYTRRTGEQIA